MIVDFLAPARAEFLEAIDHYNSQQEGLGFEFAEELEKAIERILEYPEAWPPLSRRCRRCRMNRFPCGVIYLTRGQSLLVVAVMHTSREPKTWLDRLTGEDS
jgi:plasmid stabilization system protein ParE